VKHPRLGGIALASGIQRTYKDARATMFDGSARAIQPLRMFADRSDCERRVARAAGLRTRRNARKIAKERSPQRLNSWKESENSDRRAILRI
jgi:hypothetical protein